MRKQMDTSFMSNRYLKATTYSTVLQVALSST